MAIIAGDRALPGARCVYERDTVSLLAPQALPTSLTGLTDVTFSHEQQLIVYRPPGEPDGPVSVHRGRGVSTGCSISGDATDHQPRRPPADPPAAKVPVLMYEADGRAHSFTGAPTLIRPMT